MRSKSSPISSANSMRAISRGQLARCWAPGCLSGKPLFDVCPHLRPRNGLFRFQQTAEALFGLGVKCFTTFCVFGLFGDRFKDEAMSGFAGVIGGTRNTGLQPLREANCCS